VGDIYHLRDWTWGIVEGNVSYASKDFGDTALTSTASVQIPTDHTIEITQGVNPRRPNRASGYRQLWHLDATQDGKGVSPTLSWTGEATKVHLPYILAGLFQRVDEADTTPYAKIFKWPTSSAVWSSTTFGYPNFSDDDGYFYGFIENSPVALRDVGILSCVPTSVTLSIDSQAESNRLRFDSSWIGRLLNTGFSATGPTAYSSLTHFVFDDMTLTIGGTTVLPYGWSVTIEPGFQQQPGGGTSCQDIAMGPHKVTGYVDILWDATASAIFNDLQDDSNGYQTLPIAIYWGAGNDPVTTDGELRIELNAQFQSTPNQGSEVRIRRLNFECIKDATYEDIEIQIADAVDRTWQT